MTCPRERQIHIPVNRLCKGTEQVPLTVRPAARLVVPRMKSPLQPGKKNMIIIARSLMLFITIKHFIINERKNDV